MKRQTTFILLLLFFFSSLYAFEISSCDDSWYEGEGTQYGGVAGSNGGNCGIYVEEGDIYHCAMNHLQYDSSSACGGCVRVLGPLGEITLQVVDRCPECKFGDIDLSTEAFALLAQMKDGRIPIKWQFVPCKDADDIKILFAAGTSSYYFKAIFYNLKNRIAKVEYLKSDGSYEEIHREMYNFFVCQGGIDEDKTKIGPYSFRLTDMSGQQILLPNITYVADQEISTGVQFPVESCKDCAGVVDGEAQIDNCGVCSGGTTGIEPNSSCKKDCIGYWNGEAYLDNCGFCVGGKTGGTPCADNALPEVFSQKTNLIRFSIYDVFGRILLSSDDLSLLQNFRFDGQTFYLLNLQYENDSEYKKIFPIR